MLIISYVINGHRRMLSQDLKYFVVVYQLVLATTHEITSEERLHPGHSLYLVSRPSVV